jgi:hypothetical protein
VTFICVLYPLQTLTDLAINAQYHTRTALPPKHPERKKLQVALKAFLVDEREKKREMVRKRELEMKKVRERNANRNANKIKGDDAATRAAIMEAAEAERALQYNKELIMFSVYVVQRHVTPFRVAHEHIHKFHSHCTISHDHYPLDNPTSRVRSTCKNIY